MAKINSSSHETTVSMQNKSHLSSIPGLNQDCLRDITEEAAAGAFDLMIGRRAVVENVIDILGRKRKGNPVLLGEAGVGKTAILEGLAQRIVNLEVPDSLKHTKVIEVDMCAILTGTKWRGEFEAKLKGIIDGVLSHGNVIVFIDEIHSILSAGETEGSASASELLKPKLARGSLRCIGATTNSEFAKTFLKDKALERRFNPVHVPEPSVSESIEIIRGLAPVYEKFHGVRYSDDAMIAATALSKSYISDLFLPDKAIDLLDISGSIVKNRNESLRNNISESEVHRKHRIQDLIRQNVRTSNFRDAILLKNIEKSLENRSRPHTVEYHKAISKRHIKSREELLVKSHVMSEIISSRTGIPIRGPESNDKKRIYRIANILEARVLGQKDAVLSVSRSLRRTGSGLRNSQRPLGSFIFTGPSGVGKTELAKSIAESFYGSPEKLITLDMSEFMEKHSISKIIGSPPGYVGYGQGNTISDRVRKNPYILLLLDEVEKAHPDIFNILLQVLDEGKITDSTGNIVKFAATVIILTSNIGSKIISAGSEALEGYRADMRHEEKNNLVKSAVGNSLSKFFRAELLNRCDDIILFKNLSKDSVIRIAAALIRSVIQMAKSKGINLRVCQGVIYRIILSGFKKTFGARPIRRSVEKLIVDPLSEKILASDLTSGDNLVITTDASGRCILLLK